MSGCTIINSDASTFFEYFFFTLKAGRPLWQKKNVEANTAASQNCPFFEILAHCGCGQHIIEPILYNIKKRDKRANYHYPKMTRYDYQRNTLLIDISVIVDSALKSEKVQFEGNFNACFCFSKFYGKLGFIICILLVAFPSHLKRLHSEILTRKVDLWIFSLVSLMKKHHKTTFLVNISAQKITIS